MVAKTHVVGERDIPFDAHLRFDVGVASFVIAPTSGTVDERIEIVGQDYSLVVMLERARYRLTREESGPRFGQLILQCGVGKMVSLTKHEPSCAPCVKVAGMTCRTLL